MLPGSWVMVARVGSDTVVLGDRAGLSRAYFAPVDLDTATRGVLWSNEAKRLAAYLHAGPRLDVLALDLVVSGIELYGGGVPLERVETVPPGWLLRVGPDRDGLERWDAPATLASFEQTAALVAPTLVDAVAGVAQSAGVLSADLSGGLDSRALSTLGAQHRGLDVITYSDYPDSEDLRYAQQFAQRYPALRQHVITRDHSTLHYAGLDDPAALPVTDLPSEDVLGLSSHQAVFECAAGLGSSDHMLGLGGDQVLASRPGKLFAQRRASRLKAIAGAFRLARDQRAPVTGVLGALERTGRTSYQQSLHHTARLLETGAIDPGLTCDAWRHELAWSTPASPASWLTPEWADQLSRRLHTLAEYPPAYTDAGAAHEWQEVRRFTANLAGFKAAAARVGLELHMPYFDAGMLECLRLPGYLREPSGTCKPLVRKGMATILGPALITPTIHGSLVNTYQLGLRAHQHSLRELVASSALVKAGIFRRDAVNHALERAIAGIGGRTVSMTPLLAAELWLRQLDLRHDTWWKQER
jgi:asparagine synthase (glutamine-hydrolysing)